ncbi:MAG: hypothetical protein RR561_06890 [Peptostreptococcus sp.]|uniref:hypothetical protein n=1 Tax=Peptostreptococcus sp. TaxID=1262 RepID=UPI002FC5F669
MKLTRLYIIFETNGYSMLAINSKKDKMDVELDEYYPFESKNTSYAINQLCFKICDKIRVLQSEKRVKVAELICIAQSSDMWLNDIELLSKSKQKEIEKLIDIKLDQVKGLDSRKYIKYYEKLEKINEDFTKYRICIFPRYIIELMSKISKISKIGCKKIYASYQIVDNLEIASDSEDKTIPVLEFRKEDIVLYIRKNTKIESTMIVDDRHIDSSLISYLSRSDNITVFGNEENNGYRILKKQLKFKDNLGKYALINNLEGKKKPVCNFYEKEESRSVYVKIMKLLFLFLLIISIKSINVFAENIKLENEKEAKQEIAIKENREEELWKNKNFDNLYGVDIWKIYDISTVLSKKLKNIDIDQEKIVFEFLLSDKSQIASILREEVFEGAEVEYIRSEEISRKEAKQIYGIGENNEESNKETREKNNNQEKTKQKGNQENKEKSGNKDNQEKSNQTAEEYPKENDSKKETYKENSKEKTSKKSCWKKIGEKEKENILRVIDNYRYSYAEESVEKIEVSDEIEEVILEKNNIDQTYKIDKKNKSTKTKEEGNQEKTNNVDIQRKENREDHKELQEKKLEENKEENENSKTVNVEKNNKIKEDETREDENKDREMVKVYLIKISIKK